MPKYANYKRIRRVRERLGKQPGVFFQKPLRKGEGKAILQGIRSRFAGEKPNEIRLPKCTSLTQKKMDEMIRRLEGKPGLLKKDYKVTDRQVYYDFGMRVLRRAVLAESSLPKQKRELVSKIMPYKYYDNPPARGIELAIEYLRRFGKNAAARDFAVLRDIAKAQRLTAQSQAHREDFQDLFINPAISIERIFSEISKIAANPQENAALYEGIVRRYEEKSVALEEKLRSGSATAVLEEELKSDKLLVERFRARLALAREFLKR